MNSEGPNGTHAECLGAQGCHRSGVTNEKGRKQDGSLARVEARAAIGSAGFVEQITGQKVY